MSTIYQVSDDTQPGWNANAVIAEIRNEERLKRLSKAMDISGRIKPRKDWREKLKYSNTIII